MLIAVDVGNIHTVIGIYQDDELTHHWRIATNHERTTDEHGALLSTLFAGEGLSLPPRPEGVVIACVVPPLNQVMEQLTRRYFKCEPLMVGPGVEPGMPLLYENPKEIGADRIVNAIAALIATTRLVSWSISALPRPSITSPDAANTPAARSCRGWDSSCWTHWWRANCSVAQADRRRK